MRVARRPGRHGVTRSNTAILTQGVGSCFFDTTLSDCRRPTNNVCHARCSPNNSYSAFFTALLRPFLDASRAPRYDET